MKTTYEKFGVLLDSRLTKNIFTTEDSVRYTFFAALLESTALDPEDVIMEYPHPTIAKAEIDTWIPEYAGETVAIEFKYDREIPSGKNSPRPQKAGKIFHDFHRLIQITSEKPLRRVFVYLTSREMAKYMENERNGLDDFFLLKEGGTLQITDEFFQSKSATFQCAVKIPFRTRLKSMLNQKLANEHELRIYEIQN